MLSILRGIGRVRAVKPAFHLRRQLRFRPEHALVAHRLVLGCVGSQLGAVHGDVAQPNQARTPAQRQHLHEQVAQGGQMPATELIDRAEVRPVQRGDGVEVQSLLAAARDPARAINALAVGVEQQRHHHARVVRRKSTWLGVGRQNGAKVQLLAHNVTDQMCRVFGRHEVLHR